MKTISIFFLVLLCLVPGYSNREPEIQDSQELIVLRLVWCQSNTGYKVGKQ